MTVLEARAVSMAIGAATLLDNVNLRFTGGEIVAIVGPNGAGKSTLLRLLSADLRATRGAIALRGRDIHAWSSTELAARRAMLSQHVTVSFPFTVAEIVTMGGGNRGRARVQPLAEAAIDEVGLGALRHRELPTLSGGEQQRAHLARILVQLACGEAEHGPGILMLDEPTSSLDLRHQIAVVETAKRRAGQGTAVVAVLHDLNLAARFADRIVVLHKAAVVADGRPGDIVTDGLLRRVFEVDVPVQRGDDGAPFILPQMVRGAVAEVDAKRLR